MKREGSGDKVASFDQSGAFFYKCAKRMREREHMMKALSLMRKAVEKEPENIDFAINLAEIYTEMDCFAESNQILFPLLHRRRDLTECYFSMGCNFFGMRDYEKARESLIAYISMDDTGENFDEARGLLATIGFYERPGRRPDRLTRLLSRAGQALDYGENQRAARLCEKALSLEKNLLPAITMLCEAYVRLGKYDIAATYAAKVLNRIPGNIDALCHLAVCKGSMGLTDEAERIFQAAYGKCLEDAAESNLTDLQKIGMTACMLNIHDKVYSIFRKLNKAIPYNKKILHYLALACMNIGSAAEAEACWSKALRLDPGNTIFSYYLAAARNKDEAVLQYEYQVPAAELMSRIYTINDTLDKGIDAAKHAWQNDPSFAALLKWGLAIQDSAVRQTMLMIISSFCDAEAEKVLREMLVSQSESDSMKQNILLLLKKMNSKEPYVAFLNRGIVEVSVNVLKSKYALPQEYAKVVEDAMSDLGEEAGADALDRMLKMWVCFCDRMRGDFPPLQGRGAWVAALQCAYLISIDKKPPVNSLLKRYKLNIRKLMFRVKKILQAQEK